MVGNVMNIGKLNPPLYSQSVWAVELQAIDKSCETVTFLLQDKMKLFTKSRVLLIWNSNVKT